MAISSMTAAPQFSAQRILADTRVLASDEFEGRAPGSAGEEKTVDFLVSSLKNMGLKPGNPDGTYVQRVPLVGITSHPELSFDVGGTTLALMPINDYVASTSRVAKEISVKKSDVVFVGYGVVAPEFGWDDFKDVEVRGKTVVMLINDPPVRDPADPAKLDARTFGGEAMTYYGRWTYKYESAAARGAAACLIVHETGPAAYPFAVVVGSRSRENFELRTPDGNAGHVAVEGWLTLDAAQRLFKAAGQDFAQLKKAAVSRSFRPVSLNAQATISVKADLRNVDSKNVVAKIEGSDPARRHEYLIYTAHWDHLGREPKLKGDQIFNGAADNAGGVAALLEIARAFQSSTAERPPRSVLFLWVTAEEKGLLGSKYYAENPLYPLNRTLANLNIDGVNQYGPTEDVEIVGAGATTIEAIGTEVAKAQGRVTRPESHPERGGYYRSDHFEFAKVGVPAYRPKSGLQYIGQPADYGEKLSAAYVANDYHKVTDEVKPDWTFEGAAQDAEMLYQVGSRLAQAKEWPQWLPGNEFKARRDAQLKVP